MNLDDLMEVWRSQDASPLHGVNETLLRLALRQDQAKLQAQRRMERWMAYLISASIVVGMTLFLAIMIYPYDDDVLTGWDYGIPDHRRGRRPVLGARDICEAAGAGRARATLWRVASRSNQPASRAARLRGDEGPPDKLAAHCAAADRLRVHHHSRQLADQRPVLQRYQVVAPDRLHGLLDRPHRGRQSLVAAPLGATGPAAAQAPAGGVAEGARRSVEFWR